MLIIGFALWSLVAWLVIGWQKHPAVVRKGVPWLLLLGGLGALAAAPFLSGEYSRDVVLFIGGPNAHRVETITRSYAGLSAGIGVVLWALYAAARWGHRLPWKSPMGTAFKLTLAVILLRIFFEKLGVSMTVATYIGIIWLIVPLAVYFGWQAARTGRQSRLWLWMLGYTYSIRFLILGIMLAATFFQLGTHFDNSGITTFSVLGETHSVEAGSWDLYQTLILLPQLLLWPAVTMAAGLVFGLPAYLVARRRGR